MTYMAGTCTETQNWEESGVVLVIYSKVKYRLGLSNCFTIALKLLVDGFKSNKVKGCKERHSADLRTFGNLAGEFQL